MSEPTHSEILEQVLKDELAEQRKLKDSLSSRATVVITSSGSLVTLLFAAAALVTREQSFVVGRWWLIAAGSGVLCLIIAAGIALFINAPKLTRIRVFEELPREFRPERMSMSDSELSIRVLSAQQQMVDDFLRDNSVRSRTLLLALGAECFGVLAVSVASSGIILSKLL